MACCQQASAHWMAGSSDRKSLGPDQVERRKSHAMLKATLKDSGFRCFWGIVSGFEHSVTGIV
jgi:hypothetical protein